MLLLNMFTYFVVENNNNNKKSVENNFAPLRFEKKKVFAGNYKSPKIV